jgi:DNA-nicking Smr family endonuclease
MSAARRGSRPSDPPGKGDRDESFADAIADTNVEPLGDRHARVAATTGKNRSPIVREPARFDFPDPGEPLLGIASGIQTSQLRRLRAGRIRPERIVDLHEHESAAARRELLEALAVAIENRERCVLVIHGKGLRSKAGPVLRAALPEWLADPKLAGRVLAFAPASPEDGGRGASYVLLRRR